MLTVLKNPSKILQSRSYHDLNDQPCQCNFSEKLEKLMQSSMLWLQVVLSIVIFEKNFRLYIFTKNSLKSLHYGFVSSTHTV